MGHYDGLEEEIYAERKKRDDFLRSLSTEQFYKASLLDERERLMGEIKRLQSSLKENSKILSKLRFVTIPKETMSILKGYLGDYQYKFKFDTKLKELIKRLTVK